MVGIDGSGIPSGFGRESRLLLIPGVKWKERNVGLILQRFEDLVILLEAAEGFHRGYVQYPAQKKNPDGEADLPGPRSPRSPPDQGERQRAHAAEGDDDK